MNIQNALKWRYATKRMNGSRVPENKLEVILEAIRLSASSSGLQPYRVIVVEDSELRKTIHARACSQNQALECSHLLVFASWVHLDDGQVDEYMHRIAAVRHLPLEALKGLSNSIKSGIASRMSEQNADWAARQAYIGLGFGLTAAALEQVDACPMEGFSPAEMDDVLNLTSKNLRSVALMALGYRDTEKDPLAGAAKVRVSSDVFFIRDVQ